MKYNLITINLVYLTLSWFFLLPVWGSLFLVPSLWLRWGWSLVLGVWNDKSYLFSFHLIGSIDSFSTLLLGFIAFHSSYVCLCYLRRRRVLVGMTMFFCKSHTLYNTEFSFFNCLKKKAAKISFKEIVAKMFWYVPSNPLLVFRTKWNKWISEM